MRRIFDRREKGPEGPRPRALSGSRRFCSFILLILPWSLDSESPEAPVPLNLFFLFSFKMVS